ncbi:unnamed protein product [Notodromas monacha]|uniref:Uncharacterized protein n=1 Tax=Notodromas monacha TaxID=399045 RepID=A0A7R9BDP9_9CRUS|nr:unnamed protein product [Notodromas monacha]CAG0912584.1 unnamed protein product [Notodromas monacha]
MRSNRHSSDGMSIKYQCYANSETRVSRGKYSAPILTAGSECIILRTDSRIPGVFDFPKSTPESVMIIVDDEYALPVDLIVRYTEEDGRRQIYLPTVSSQPDLHHNRLADARIPYTNGCGDDSGVSIDQTRGYKHGDAMGSGFLDGVTSFQLSHRARVYLRARRAFHVQMSWSEADFFVRGAHKGVVWSRA